MRAESQVGVPAAVGDMPAAIELTLVTGGVELLGPKGGLRYADTERTPVDALTVMNTVSDDEGDGTRHIVSAADGAWAVELEYRRRDRTPRLAFAFTVRRAPDAEAVLLRDVEITLTVPLDDVSDWVLIAPGNQFRSDLPVEALEEPVRIFTGGGVHGSPGVIALTRRSRPETVVLWPRCETEVGSIDLRLDGNRVVTTIGTGVAGRVSPGGAGLRWRALHLDRLAAAWPEVRGALASWQRPAPSDIPSWMRRAHIYEAHVGFSVFDGGHRYERYPSLAALRADLPRIQDLGFDVIQLMPRHPYPSYNVHDYADVTTSYGDEAELRELVEECHRRGMRLLLDVIMHGVIDKEVMAETFAAVCAGPYAQRLRDGTIDYLSRTAEDIAWCRHIVEYEPYWREGAPDRHPLADEHPEWFMRDSAGAITRRYTKAFDIAHRGWQRYFIDACVAFVERLGIDGFRVDAPTYNAFATWAPHREARASYGPLASLGLLRDLRTRLREIRDDVVVYTEPTGALFRAATDGTYNYDEHWLMEALFGDPHPQGERLVRNAHELARWFEDRDAAIPAGSTIVHHIDSHDSIWWRLPSAQWRRERFGPEAAVALLAVFSMIGGAFMTFMGGEDGIEEELRRAHRLRRHLSGPVEYAAVGDVFLARHPEALVAVNLAPQAVEVSLGDGAMEDEWSGERVDGGRVPFRPYQPRVLRRSASSVITAS